MILLRVELWLVSCRILLDCCSFWGLDQVILFALKLFIILIDRWDLGWHFDGTIAPTLPSVISSLAAFSVLLDPLFFLLFFSTWDTLWEAGENLDFLAPIRAECIPVALLRVWTILGGCYIFAYGLGDSFHNVVTFSEHVVDQIVCPLDVLLSLCLHMLMIQLRFLERG